MRIIKYVLLFIVICVVISVKMPAIPVNNYFVLWMPSNVWSNYPVAQGQMKLDLQDILKGTIPTNNILLNSHYERSGTNGFLNCWHYSQVDAATTTNDIYTFRTNYQYRFDSDELIGECGLDPKEILE